MDGRTRKALGLAGALLVAALAVSACGRGTDARANEPAGPGTTPAAQESLTPDAEATEVPSPEPDAGSPAPIFDPGTAIDAVDSDLAALDQFLAGLDAFVAGTDGGAYGGE